MTSSAAANTPPVDPKLTPPPTLRSRAIRAASWRTGAYIASQVVRVFSNIVLAKLLYPEAFGLVALGSVIIQGLRMFSELGIGPAIIQRKEALDDDFLKTAWTLQIMRGAGLWIGGALLAWPMAIYYDDPRLTALLIVIGSTAAIDGFQSTAQFTLSRDLIEGRRATLDLAANVVTRVVMIVWAFYWPTYWALVGGTMIAAVFKVAASHVWLPGIRHSIRWHKPSVLALVHFGKWVFIGTVFAFFGQQLDKLMLGKLEAMGVLGVYTIALTFASLPREGVGVTAGAVLFPALAEIFRRQPERFPEQVHRTRAILLPLGLFATLSTALLAPPFFELFYDEEYAAAGWITSLAAITSWLLLLNSTTSQILLALGQTRTLAASSFVRVLVMALACWAGHQLYGLPGFIIGTAVGAAAPQVMLYIALAKSKISIHFQDLLFTCLLLAIGGLTVLGQYAMLQNWEVETTVWASPLLACLVLAVVGAWTARVSIPKLLNK